MTNEWLRESDATIQGKVNRVIGIWKDRQVLPPSTMEEIISLPPVDLNKVAPPTSAPTSKPVAPAVKTGSPLVPQPQEPQKKVPKSLEVRIYALWKLSFD